MFKWEVGLLVFFALLIVAIAASETISDTLLSLLDTLLFQTLVVAGCVGLLAVSPVVGFAACIVVALLFVMRNNTHVMRRIRGPVAPLPSISGNLSRETKPGVEEITPGSTFDNIGTEEEVPEGQYPINEERPMSSPTLREFEYAPFEDTGSNIFKPVGTSIDEKGIMPKSILPSLGLA